MISIKSLIINEAYAFFMNFEKMLVINSFFVLLNPRWLPYRGATWMSPLGGGTGRTPRSTKDFCHLVSCSL